MFAFFGITLGHINRGNIQKPRGQPYDDVTTERRREGQKYQRSVHVICA